MSTYIMWYRHQPKNYVLLFWCCYSLLIMGIETTYNIMISASTTICDTSWGMGLLLCNRMRRWSLGELVLGINLIIWRFTSRHIIYNNKTLIITNISTWKQLPLIQSFNIAISITVNKYTHANNNNRLNFLLQLARAQRAMVRDCRISISSLQST